MTKKVFLFLLFFFLIGAGVVFFLLHRLGPWNAASFLPKNTTAFLEFPDLPQTLQRWKESNWNRFTQDKEILPLLKKPQKLLSDNLRQAITTSATKNPDQEFNRLIKALRPGRFFIALVPEEKRGSWILGCQFFGQPEKSAESLSAFHHFLDQRWGKGDQGAFSTQELPGTTISYATHGGVPLYSVTQGEWIFISNSKTTLLTTAKLQRKGTTSPSSLASTPNYHKIIDQLLYRPDLLFYGGSGKIFSIFPILIPLLGNEKIISQVDSIGLTWRLTQKGIQEKSFLLGNFINLSKISHHGIDTTSTKSVALLERCNQWEELLNKLQTNPNIPEATKKLLSAEELDFQWLSSLLQPTTSFSCQWDHEEGLPSFLLFLTSNNPSGLQEWFSEARHHFGFETEEHHNPSFLSFSFPHSNPNLALSLGIAKEKLLIASNPEGMNQGFSNILAKKTPSTTLASSKKFRPYRKLYQQASLGFTYIDIAVILQHIYPPLRSYWQKEGFRKSAAASLEEYLDASKLPSEKTFTRYLSPIIATQSAQKEGISSFSEGPMSFNMLWILGNLLYFSKNMLAPTTPTNNLAMATPTPAAL